MSSGLSEELTSKYDLLLDRAADRVNEIASSLAASFQDMERVTSSSSTTLTRT